MRNGPNLLKMIARDNTSKREVSCTRFSISYIKIIVQYEVLENTVQFQKVQIGQFITRISVQIPFRSV